MAIGSGDLITRNYRDLLGVDFSNRKDEISLKHSPDALNVWRNYKNNKGICIETRPDIELFLNMSNTIYGLFFYTINNVDHMIIHCGTSLYDYNPSTKELTTIKSEGMNPKNSVAVVCNNIFFILDGINYLEYDGQTLKEVEGTTPLIYISNKPSGAGTQYNPVNLLTPSVQESYSADGTSTEYVLHFQNIDSVDSVVVDGVTKTVTTDYTVDLVNGKVNFVTAPSEPGTVGSDNVYITYSKTQTGYRNRINKCTLMTIFNDNVFYSGNQDYPNYMFYCQYNNETGQPDPRYIPDTFYYREGVETSKVKSMVAGNNSLWVFKEPGVQNTAIFYHTPAVETVGEVQQVVYPQSHSSISTGCVSKAINFNDDIVFFSERGMEGLATTDVTTEQLLAHRSTYIDSKLLNETNYDKLLLAEWEGYLLVAIDNKMYIADSRKLSAISNHNEYNWFYWEFDDNITYMTTKANDLYICMNKAIYTLTKTDTTINSYWTTKDDEFDYPQYRKTTNKKGCVVDITGDEVMVSVKTDNNDYEKINTYKNTKGYIVPKIKKKKWKSIQLKFSSNKPFSISEVIISSFIGSYVKR